MERRTINKIERGHFKRMELEDAILVVNINNYVGKNYGCRNYKTYIQFLLYLL